MTVERKNEIAWQLAVLEGLYFEVEGVRAGKVKSQININEASFQMGKALKLIHSTHKDVQLFFGEGAPTEEELVEFTIALGRAKVNHSKFPNIDKLVEQSER